MTILFKTANEPQDTPLADAKADHVVVIDVENESFRVSKSRTGKLQTFEHMNHAPNAAEFIKWILQHTFPA